MVNSFEISTCMQVIEHDDEETHASFSPLSTGASLRSFTGLPFDAVRSEDFCVPSQADLALHPQGPFPTNALAFPLVLVQPPWLRDIAFQDAAYARIWTATDQEALSSAALETVFQSSM